MTGRFAAIGQAIEEALAAGRTRRIAMNIDGVTAVIYGELGFPASLARGLFCLSRSVGLLAHAWEQMQQGERIKGPLPRAWPPSYAGPAARGVPGQVWPGGLGEQAAAPLQWAAPRWLVWRREASWRWAQHNETSGATSGPMPKRPPPYAAWPDAALQTLE